MLTQLAAGAAAFPAVALGSRWPHARDDEPPCECARPRGGPYADYFPNVVVHTHEGRRALFYNDLLRGSTVLINCMSVGGEALNRSTANLVRVHRLLGDRAGRDVFMYSLTVEPERDTPRALAAFAEEQGVGPGWLFLTGRPDVLDALRERLFADLGARGHAHGHARQDCSLGLVRYGNEAVGLWGAVPTQTEPEWIVRRLSWVGPRKAHPGQFTRRGPSAAALPNPARRT